MPPSLSPEIQAFATGFPLTLLHAGVTILILFLGALLYVMLTPHREIVALADPEESDFNYSRERWQLEADGDGAILKYEFELEPSFWVPPVIGPYVMKRVLRAGGSDAVDRIEALAQGKKPKR